MQRQRRAEPPKQDARRDLGNDLKICGAASPGPWAVMDSRVDKDYYDATDTESVEGCVAWHVECAEEYAIMHGMSGPGEITPELADLHFCAVARTGWPIAIRRAIEAEAELADLRMRMARLVLDDACPN